MLFEVLSGGREAARSGRARGLVQQLRSASGPGACRRSSDCVLSPYPRQGTAVRRSHGSRVLGQSGGELPTRACSMARSAAGHGAVLGRLHSSFKDPSNFSRESGILPDAAAVDTRRAIGTPSSTKVRMKPPGSASASASTSTCTDLAVSPCAWRATAWSTITLSRSSAQPFASACWRQGSSTASAADGSPWARWTRAWLMGSSCVSAS